MSNPSRERLIKAMAETYRVGHSDCAYLLDVILDELKLGAEALSRVYWGDDIGWGAGTSEREPFEEGLVSAILRRVFTLLEEQ